MVIKVFLDDGHLICPVILSSRHIPRDWGRGVHIRGFGQAWREAKKPADKEHVTPYIWNNPGIFKVKNIESKVDLSGMRWTLDRKEDLDFAREYISVFTVNSRSF